MIALIAVALAVVSTAHAQCVQLSTITVLCSETGCDGSAQIGYPTPSPYGVIACANHVACCQEQILSYSPCGNCQATVLNDPKIEKMIREVAETQPVLVASCTGEYQPFRNQPSAPAKVKELSLDSRSRKILN